MIKNIVRKRQKKIREIRSIINPGQKYTLKDEAKKFEIKLEEAMKKTGSYDSQDCRQKVIRVMR